MNGKIEIDSNSSGSTFIIHIPLKNKI